MIGDSPRLAVGDPTYRLIPSRFPPVPAFEDVAAAADLGAVMELEGWTNDRLVQQRLARLPEAEWVYNVPNASIVMAAFLHAAPHGLRFSAGDLGAWYAGLGLNTAIAEVAHHLRRETVNTNMRGMSVQYRTCTAMLDGRYVDVRGRMPELCDAVDHGASQAFGEAVRGTADLAGIVYDSVRHAGGVNVVCFRPRAVRHVAQAAHLEIDVRPRGKVAVRRLP